MHGTLAHVFNSRSPPSSPTGSRLSLTSTALRSSGPLDHDRSDYLVPGERWEQRYLQSATTGSTITISGQHRDHHRVLCGRLYVPCVCGLPGGDVEQRTLTWAPATRYSQDAAIPRPRCVCTSSHRTNGSGLILDPEKGGLAMLPSRLHRQILPDRLRLRSSPSSFRQTRSISAGVAFLGFRTATNTIRVHTSRETRSWLPRSTNTFSARAGHLLTGGGDRQATSARSPSTVSPDGKASSSLCVRQ